MIVRDAESHFWDDGIDSWHFSNFEFFRPRDTSTYFHRWLGDRCRRPSRLSDAPAATPSCVVLAQNDFAEAAGERDGERSEIPGPPIAASSRLQV